MMQMGESLFYSAKAAPRATTTTASPAPTLADPMDLSDMSCVSDMLSMVQTVKPLCSSAGSPNPTPPKEVTPQIPDPCDLIHMVNTVKPLKSQSSTVKEVRAWMMTNPTTLVKSLKTPSSLFTTTARLKDVGSPRLWRSTSSQSVCPPRRAKADMNASDTSTSAKQ